MAVNPKRPPNRWQNWLRTHKIFFSSLSEAERARVLRIYHEETKGAQPVRRTSEQPLPAAAPVQRGASSTASSPLPPHLEAMGAGVSPPPPSDPSPPQAEVRIAPSTIWATMWDLVYRGRAALQYYPAVRQYVPFAEVERIWNLSDDQAEHLGEATATAWNKYIPTNHPANVALQQIWPALMLASAVIIVEKAKGDEWAGLIRILQEGTAVPPQYDQNKQPLEPITPQPQAAPPNPWEAMVNGQPVNGHPVVAPQGGAAGEIADQPTVSYRDQLAAAGADVSAIPPNGVGLRQALTKDTGPRLG